MLDKLRQEANALLDQFKRDRYVRGSSCLEQAGALAGGLGSKAANALSCLGRVTNDLEDYFGVSRVSAIAEKAGLGLR